MRTLAIGLACTGLSLAAESADDNAPKGMMSPDQAKPFEFVSPREALEALRTRPGVEIRSQNGWTIAEDHPNFTIWSFTPNNHPAHPSGVKRSIVKNANGDISIIMSAKCGATKSACDKLMEEFHALNDRLRESIEKKGSGK